MTEIETLFELKGTLPRPDAGESVHQYWYRILDWRAAQPTSFWDTLALGEKHGEYWFLLDHYLNRFSASEFYQQLRRACLQHYQDEHC